MLSEAVQQAVFTRVDATLSIPAYDRVPQDQSHDFVIIGEDTILADDTKTANGVAVEFEISIWTVDPAFKSLKQYIDQLYAAFHRQDLAITGYTTTQPQFQNSYIFPEPEGQRAVMRFRTTAQPT